MMKLFRLNIQDMPRFEQTTGFNLFIKNLLKKIKIDDYFSTKDYWNIMINSELSLSELNMIIEDVLKMQQWSHRVDFSGYISSRPIISKTLEHTNEIPTRPVYPVIEFGTKQEQEIFFRQLDEGKLIYVPINSNIIPERLMRCFLWKEHYAFFYNNQAVLWVNKNSDPKNFTKALNAKLFDSEEMWKRDLNKDYKIMFNNSEYLFMKGFEFLQKMKLIAMNLVKLNNLDISIDHLYYVIDHYKLDKLSEIVNEFPSLERIISSKIYNYELNENSIYYNIIFTAETIIMINKIAEKNFSVSSSYDPYGVRNRLKRLSDLDMNWLELIIDSNLKSWIEKRIESQLNPSIKTLNCPLIDKYQYRNLIIDQNIIKRLINLIKNQDITNEESITICDFEYKLLSDINIGSIKDIPNLLEKLEFYINEYKIVPYKERKYILQLFLNKFFV